MAENNSLLEKVLGLQDKYEALQAQLADPAVMADMKKFVQLNKDYKELEPIIKAGHEYKKMVEDLAAAKAIMANEKDEDLREMAREEISFRLSARSVLMTIMIHIISMRMMRHVRLPVRFPQRNWHS